MAGVLHRMCSRSWPLGELSCVEPNTRFTSAIHSEAELSKNKVDQDFQMHLRFNGLKLSFTEQLAGTKLYEIY